MEQYFLEKLKEVLEIEDRELNVSDVFRDYPEWNSLNFLTLISMNDEEYDLVIEGKEFKTLHTVEDIYNPFSLVGKVILVTGASSGIGRSIAIECSKMGARIVITGRDEVRLNDTLQAMSGEGHLVVKADLTDSDDLESLSDEIPVLDGVVNNAGCNKRMLCQYIKDEELANVLNTNLVSSILLTKNLLKKKKVKAGGSIVFMSSIAVYHSSIGDSVYSATKGAISSFARVLAMELAPKKIT